MPRDLSGKRVHVYSNSTFIERIVLDGYITKCIYLFIIFYLKLTFITACLLKQKESEQKRRVWIRLFKLISLLKNSSDIFICCGFIFVFIIIFLQHVYNHVQEKRQEKKLH